MTLPTDPNFHYVTYELATQDPVRWASLKAKLAAEGYELVPPGTSGDDVRANLDWEVLHDGIRWMTMAERKAGYPQVGGYGSRVVDDHTYLIRRRVTMVTGQAGTNRTSQMSTTSGVPFTVKQLEEQRAKADREKHMRFFFGCGVTDESKLPPPPRVLDTWPELDDSW